MAVWVIFLDSMEGWDRRGNRRLGINQRVANQSVGSQNVVQQTVGDDRVGLFPHFRPLNQI